MTRFRHKSKYYVVSSLGYLHVECLINSTSKMETTLAYPLNKIFLISKQNNEVPTVCPPTIR
jgi:hypothetical protein